MIRREKQEKIDQYIKAVDNLFKDIKKIVKPEEENNGDRPTGVDRRTVIGVQGTKR